MIQDQAFTTRASIGGEWRDTGRTFTVTNPATGEAITDLSDCGEAEAREAADAAVTAFRSWSRLTARERADPLRAFARLLREHSREIGQLITLENGRPFHMAVGEPTWAADQIDYYVGASVRLTGELLPPPAPGQQMFALRQPVGPVLAITPWNYPVLLASWKLGPALASGCTVIHKPAEQTPLSALRLAELFEQAGGPPGVYQVLPCRNPAPVADVLLDDPRVRKLAFTGSVETGRHLYRRAAATFKRVTLELGGNCPLIVFDDADLDAVQAFLGGRLCGSAGQVCLSPNRVLAQGRVADEFAGKAASFARAQVLGDPFDPATTVGPLSTAQNHARVSEHVRDAVERGARLLAGGRSPGGLYYEPTVLLDVQPGTRLLEEETFGPVVPISRFTSEEEAVEAANRTEYGLAAHIFTRDMRRAWRVAERLECGAVTVNGTATFTGDSPFGGWKASGVGRELGRWGLDAYLELKSVSMPLG